MTRKQLLTVGLFGFVAISLTLAVADFAGWRRTAATPSQTTNQSPVATSDETATTALTAMVLLGLINLPVSSGSLVNSLRERFQKLGIVGAGLLGLLFALSFCPVSAALFFGSLIPLAVAEQSLLLLPAAYGIGTGLPVFGFGVVLVFGAKSLGTVFQRVSGVEHVLRLGTGIAILLIGIYLTLQHVYRVIG